MDIIATFKTAKRAAGIRPSTQRDYDRVLGRLSQHISPDNLNRDNVREYVADLHDQPWAPATVAIHIRYIRAFLRWLHNEGYTVSDLSRTIPAPGLATRNDAAPALIISDRGPLGGDGLYHMLRRRAKQAGLDPHRVHPHLLRKMFASWWIENGGDEQRLMAIAGWSGPEMLRIYVRLGSRQKLMEAHQQFGPVDRIIGDAHDDSL